MMYPDTDDVIASIIDTFDRYIAPQVDDEYAASLCLTVSQLLRSVRVRVQQEGQALYADNAELRLLLGTLRTEVPAPEVEVIDAACRPAEGAGYLSVRRLREDAIRLREALVACIEAIPDRDHPGRVAVRGYLQEQLQRQQPWLVDAFTGPRR
jgi:hypothetical protein